MDMALAIVTVTVIVIAMSVTTVIVIGMAIVTERLRREVEEELRLEEARRTAGPSHRPKWRPEFFAEVHLDEAPRSKGARIRKKRRTETCSLIFVERFANVAQLFLFLSVERIAS
ncbi:hypothetical protein AK812_SmicGene11837 [Symbiodinium microadriaticum]|uniref:Uncharacterized protein n=1 Tax=Symbiodinium microadriaticum TaxID=2951 RepID=A0A1Q9EC76_SYMMI|nr:hypothetical protein AK812_SmicGene11837 [Symbiodinium microadriaticum]